jgi:hypothetical protein
MILGFDDLRSWRFAFMTVFVYDRLRFGRFAFLAVYRFILCRVFAGFDCGFIVTGELPFCQILKCSGNNSDLGSFFC